MVKYNDKVKVTANNYPCAACGETGTIVDNGYYDSIVKAYRYQVKWDGKESMVFGVYSTDIKLVSSKMEHTIQGA